MTHLFFMLSVFSANDEWNGFRGFEKQGLSTSASAPVSWSQQENIEWKIPVKGRGHSSPVISGKSVYLTTAFEDSESRQTQSFYRLIAAILTFIMLFRSVPFILNAIRIKFKAIVSIANIEHLGFQVVGKVKPGAG